jgi:hypothetical protein
MVFGGEMQAKVGSSLGRIPPRDNGAEQEDLSRIKLLGEKAVKHAVRGAS